MHADSVKHLTDDELVRRLNSLVARDRAITAALLVHLAEVDSRRLYLLAGYPSMHAYCVGELKFSDDEAYKRIRVARAGREVPELLVALVEGHIHLTAARMIAAHITRENAVELVGAATHRSKLELEHWIARRFEGSDSSAMHAATASTSALFDSLLVPGPVEFAGNYAEFRWEAAVGGMGAHRESNSDRSPDTVQPAPHGPRAEHVIVAAGRPPVEERIVLKVALDRATHEKLVYARQLLGHSVPMGDIGRVLDRALDVLIARLEKQKFAATVRPRPRKHVDDVATSCSASGSASGSASRSASTAAAAPDSSAIATEPLQKRTAVSRTRAIPAEVRRAVWRRDGARCTFVAASGRRCEARHRLEFDHIVPFACGGSSTVDGLRLRCRGHNQLEAEREFGRDFVERKREAARRVRGRQARGRTAAAPTSAGIAP